MRSQKDLYGTVKPGSILEEIHLTLEVSGLREDGPSQLYRALFCDIARVSPNFVVSDYATLLRRRRQEGESFYLNTLPVMGKALEASLISGEELIIPDGWHLMKATRLPKFCYKLFSNLFTDFGLPYQAELGSDRVRQKETVHILRQVFFLFSKVHLPCSEKIRKDSLRSFESRISKDPVINIDSDILSEARRLIAHVVGSTAPKPGPLEEFVKAPWGKHGPGAVAGREQGRDKWLFHSWPGLDTKLFDWCEGKPCGLAGWLDNQPAARVVDVPKDFRGPRIICIEPKENQFAQQGLMASLYESIACNDLTWRSIDFWNTARSQEACFDASKATIDLSNASDTVSLRLAKLLFPRWFFKLVTRYRTRFVRIDDRLVKSRCLATMGNATCFPLETLVFWALSLGTLIVIKDSHRSSGQSLKLDVRVFGDDISVPLWGAEAVCDTLVAAGCEVNKGKTCLWTPIRESCGMFTYDGYPCLIARPHTLSVTDHRSWLQWKDLLTDLSGKISPALEFAMREQLQTFLEPRLRFNRKLQRLERLVPTFVQRGKHTELPAWSGLYAWQVGNDRTPFLNGALKKVKMRWQANY